MKIRTEIKQDVERNIRLLTSGRAVLVECDHFRCMAYRANDGKWKNYFSDTELEGQVTIVE